MLLYDCYGQPQCSSEGKLGQGSWTKDNEKFEKIDLFFELRDLSNFSGRKFHDSHPEYSHFTDSYIFTTEE